MRLCLPEYSEEWFTPLKPSDVVVPQQKNFATNDDIIAYVASFPPAVEGQGGDDRTFRLCCELVRDFGLSAEVALELLELYWNSRCLPPWETSVLRAKIKNAFTYGSGPIFASSRQESWGNLIPFDEQNLPEFPRGVLPPSIEAYCEQLALSSETPRDLVMTLVLAAISTAARGQYRIKVTNGFSEPSPIWAVAVLEPGNRKSFIFKSLFDPIFRYEKDLQARSLDEINKTNIKIKNMETQIASLRKRLLKSEGDHSKTMAEIESLELAMPRRKFLPRIVVSDVTPEKLAVVMAENQETIALLTDEGGFFETMGGRYSNRIPNFDLFLQGYSESPVRVDRVRSSEPVQMNAPSITIGSTVQPGVLSALSKRPEFKSLGVLSRFIYTVPRSPLGFRTGNAPEIAPELSSQYQCTMNEILNNTFQRGEF